MNDNKKHHTPRLPVERLVIPHNSLLLTQEQVNNLPDGTMLGVAWSGGNGPYIYELGSYCGVKYTKDSTGELMKDPLGFVGKKKPFTRVWLAV